MKLKKDNRPAVKVNRTLEGTIFEIIVAAILIVSWVIIIMNRNNLPASFPFTQCITVSVVSLGMLIAAYFPNSINMPVQINTPRQYALAIRMVRIIGLILSLMPATTYFHSMLSTVFCVGGMVVVIIIFTVLLHKAR